MQLYTNHQEVYLHVHTLSTIERKRYQAFRRVKISSPRIVKAFRRGNRIPPKPHVQLIYQKYIKECLGEIISIAKSKQLKACPHVKKIQPLYIKQAISHLRIHGHFLLDPIEKKEKGG